MPKTSEPLADPPIPERTKVEHRKRGLRVGTRARHTLNRGTG